MIKLNRLTNWILLIGVVCLTACNNEATTEVEVEEYTVSTEEAEAIPKEIYEKETALIQDNITYTIDDYDERLRLMEEEVLSKNGIERSELEAINTRLRLSLDTLKAATRYPEGIAPANAGERQQIERILNQLAKEIRDL
jgi:hypothetical protein